MASNGVDPTTGAPRFPEEDAPQLGADLAEVAAYAAFRGNRLRGTTAQRSAFTYHLDGLQWYDTTLRRLFQSDGTNWLYAPGEAILSGSNKGTTTNTGGWVAMNTSTGEGQNHRNDGFTYGTGGITVPQPGLYKVSATVHFPSSSAGTRRGLRIRSAAVTDPTMVPSSESIYASVPALDHRMTASGIIPVTTSIVIESYQNTGGSMANVVLAHVSAQYVGPVG